MAVIKQNRGGTLTTILDTSKLLTTNTTQTGISGAKTFTTSPNVPTATAGDSSTKSASTAFVMNAVAGFMNSFEDVYTASAAVASGTQITLPGGISYKVGTHMLQVSYNGTVCYLNNQYEEVGSQGATSTKIKILFPLSAGDELQFRITGIANTTTISDAVRKTGAENIDGVKTFNSSPVVPTPSLGDYSNNVVTSKWVKDISTAAVYVSPSGNDNNSGMTSDKAVRTITKALEVAEGLGQPAAKLVVAGGSYTENIELTQQQVSMTLLGNVSITGYLALESSSLVIDETENILSISHSSTSNPAISARNASEVYCCCSISILGLKHQAISCYGSNLWFVDDVSITVSNSPEPAVNVHDNGFVHISGNVTVNGSSLGNEVFYLFNGASVWIGGACTCAQNLLNSNNPFINVTVNSMFNISGAVTAYSPTTVRCIFFVLSENNSTIIFGGTVNLYHNPTGGNGTLYCAGSSVIHAAGDLNIQVSNISTVIDSRRNSFILIDGSSLKINGTITYTTVSAILNSATQIPSSVTVSGTVTGGRRYTAASGGQIDVAGAGANRIPGASAGYVNTSNYGYYG